MKNQPTDKMTLSTQTIQEFFTENEWDMIYNFIGKALGNDDYDREDVYAIRAKIHNLFLTPKQTQKQETK